MLSHSGDATSCTGRERKGWSQFPAPLQCELRPCVPLCKDFDLQQKARVSLPDASLVLLALLALIN